MNVNILHIQNIYRYSKLPPPAPQNMDFLSSALMHPAGTDSASYHGATNKASLHIENNIKSACTTRSMIKSHNLINVSNTS